MEYNNLYDLITGLSYGTKLHIGILFFGHYGNEKLVIPFKNTIHTSTICELVKNIPGGFPKCYRCRNLAIEKALHTQKPFGGLCINGIYEYTRPVTENGKTICIIFIGNIFTEGRGERILQKNFSYDPSLIDTLEKHFSYEQCEMLGSLIECYIRILLKEFPSSDVHLDFDPLIENLKRYMEEHLEYDMDIATLAKNFHYNRKYLGRLFKQKTGMSFHEYVNYRRIERAKQLLQTTDNTITSISLRCGFNNISYFCRLFKKSTNLSPTEYRIHKQKRGARA